MMNTIHLVLLAGGIGTRMGDIGATFPKSIMSTYDESLLQRHIRHAIEAGIKTITVSTRPEFHSILTRHIIHPSDGEQIIDVFGNPSHVSGSLPALLTVLKTKKMDKILMSFSDIYFMDNPYFNFYDIQLISKCTVGISRPFSPEELSHGGVIFESGGTVKSIVEKPIHHNTEGTRWNGLTLFSNELLLDLDDFLRNYPGNSPEGDFFEYWRRQGNNITSMQCSDFINVNTTTNLFIASTYRFAEAHLRDNTKLGNQSLRLAKSIRSHYLKIA